MRSQSNLSENVIIIEPGSSYLRIGRGFESSPKQFPHCIARKPKANISQNIEPITVRPKPNLRTNEYHKSMEVVYTEIENIFKVERKFESADQSGNYFQPIKSPVVEHAKLFELDVLTNEVEQEFYALNEAFERGLKIGYHINWPIRFGCFSTLVNYTSVLQDLEDIWIYALEKHMAVPRSSFCSFRVILVIGDVYKRNEIRHLASLLLDRLKFLRVFIHQASVCATYRIGLPTACVINIGDHKTSICCIEDGIAHSETRVNLPIGRTDVIRLFHALLLPEGLEHEHLDLSYKRLSDVDDLREALEHANQLVMDVLRDTTHDDVSKWKTDGIEPINFPFTWTHGKLNCPNISFPISSVILSNIMPFAIMSTMWENDNSLKCMLQSSAQSSEPDDPFDDLYVTLTAREKRKRGPGQSGLQNEQNTTDTTNNYNQQQQRDIELETIDPAIHNHISTSQIKPKWFNSLAEAVWWSITQCGNLISTQVNSDTPQSNIYLPGASEEVCRRLLSSILFTGGGASGAACQLLEKWLAERISQITKEKLSSTIVGVHAPPVEIISENDSADLAWTGAKLIITTDLLGDLWITQNEWQQHGSRVLREKVPFLW